MFKEDVSGTAGFVETFWMREVVLPFKAGESKLTFIFMSKALANTGSLSDTGFPHPEREMSLAPCLWHKLRCKMQDASSL